MAGLNALQWDGTPGHYEVYYLTTTDPGSGVGLWIRYTMLAALDGEASCSLWCMWMGPDGPPEARKATFPVDRMVAEVEPFRLRVGDAELSDTGMAGAVEDASWELRWDPGRPYEHVAPLLRRARVAKTVLVLPHGDVAVSGTVRLGDRELRLDGVHGGQAHLWGSKHASRWAWAHCGDFTGPEGEARPDTFLDGVSVVVPRLGREVGPSSPVVGRLLGEDFLATSPLSVVRAPSRFALTSWHFEATAGARRVVGEVDAPRASLVGVTYADPDGEKAYCYNSEASSMRLSVFDRTRRGSGGWILRDTLTSRGRAHFEYGQREPVAGLALHLT
jgi:hypothetical protein